MPNAAYARLQSRFTRIATLGEAAGLLHWDASAMMPPGGGAARGEQLATLAGLSHEILTAPEVADDVALASPDGAWDQANLALMTRAHARATALPTRLVEATARANSACEKIWREAKARADFAMVRPQLAEVVALQVEAAQALAAALGMDPYDALMDGYQRGVTAADVEPVFAAYEVFLRDALPRAAEIQARKPAPIRPQGPFPVAAQRSLCQRLSARIGLDYDHARLDESLHPFCGGSPTDVRITTFYDENNFEKALLGVLHETGHALYERGLPTAYARQPVGESAGMAAHESQSLIVEMQACRSDSFLGFLAGELQAAFGADAAAYTTKNLARMWRHVERGFIRVDADELTYPAHVILRFRLERALIAGSLRVADLPGAWNDGMRDLLGITPPDDARGCLQDIHWYDGALGYFPSYTLGAMMAAQQFAAIKKLHPGVEDSIAAGDFTTVNNWRRDNIWSVASLKSTSEIMQDATGEPLNAAHFIAHLKERYGRR